MSATHDYRNDALSRAEAEERLRDRAFQCEHHPDVNAKTMWGCPDCLADLRRRASRAEEHRQKREEAEAAVTAWQGVVEGIEAHIQDRIAMKDDADPAMYLNIIRANAGCVRRESEQIVAARWAEAKMLREARDRALAQRDALAKGLTIAAQAFREYEALAKGTPDGRIKADFNADIAKRCEDALAAAADIQEDKQ